MISIQPQMKQDTLNNVKTGDAFLVKGNGDWLSRLIRYFSGSDFIHSAIAVRIDSHLYVIESKISSRYSYQMMPIEWWFARHPNEELYLGQMPRKRLEKDTRQKIRETVLDAMESLRSYEICWIVVVYFLQNWFGKTRPQFKHAFKDKPLICSTLVQEAWERADVIPRGNYMTPGDLVDLLGGEEALIPMTDKRSKASESLPIACNDGQFAFGQLANQ